MVARLAQALDLAPLESNDLFRSAGLAPAFPETPLGADDLAPFTSVVERMLAGHDPYPAYAIDRHWNIARADGAAELFLPDAEERNVVRLTYAGSWRPLIANWSDIAWAGARDPRAARHQRRAGAVPALPSRGRPGPDHHCRRPVRRRPGRDP